MTPAAPDPSARIEAYLAAVDLQLAHKPGRVRREILAGLREHIQEALRRQDGAGDPAAALDRILAAMDAPEEFAERADSPVPTAAAPGRAPGRAGTRWFWLALAFLLVNAYGVWRWTTPGGLPAVIRRLAGPTPSAAAPALQLLSVEQANLSADRKATLRLTFNAIPHRDSLPHFLRLSTRQQAEVPYQAQGPAGTNIVWLQTDPVLDRSLTYHLRAGLPALAGAGPSTQPFEGLLAIIPDLHLERLEAESPPFEPPCLRAWFTAYPEPAGLDAYIAVEPAVAFTATAEEHWDGTCLAIRGAFQHGAVYAVTFKAGLPAANRATLEEPITRVVQVPERQSGILLDAPGRYLSPKGPLVIPVKTVNRKQWVASLQPVYENNLVQLVLREDRIRNDGCRDGELTLDLAGPAAVRTNTVVARPSEIVRGQVRLRDLVADPRGAYWLKADEQERLLVVSDLGLTTRLTPGRALVWVTSLDSGQPAAGAEVSLLARNNQALTRGLTDTQGLARLEFSADDTPYLAIARLGDDLSFLPLGGAAPSADPDLDGPAFLPPGGFEAAVFTERGVYRPSETAFVQALVRGHDGRAPAPFPALIRVRRPDGSLFRDLPVMLDAYGAAQTNIVLPEHLPTGRYTLDLAMPGTFTSLGQATLALEDFVPPQIRVAVAAPAGRVLTGADHAFRVRADHLFGRPAAGLPAGGHLTVEAAPFAPRGWEGWVFGDADTPFATVETPLGTNTLDDAGGTEFTARLPGAWHPPAALRLTFYATVLESGGRPVTARGTADADPYPFYLGLRRSWEGALRAGETQRVGVAVVLPNGAAATNETPLTLTLSRVLWNSVLREAPGGRYQWVSERQAVVVREQTVPASGARRDWPICVELGGVYMLAAHDPVSGACTRLNFEAAAPGQETIAWNRDTPSRVDLALDRERYAPGTTARLRIKAPFAGTALLTIESDRVLDARVLALEHNTADVDIPVLESYAPNVYCVVTLVRAARAESVWSPHGAVGARALLVEPPDRRLMVTAETPARATPQSRLAARLTVRGTNGVPAAGAVTVMAVDEGICLLTDLETPDPNRLFLGQRRLTVAAADLYRDLVPILEDTVSGTAPAGGDAEGPARHRRLNPIRARRFKPVSLWQAAVPLGADGRAEVAFDVPEFTGTLRLMAVAYNGRQAGSAEARVEVKRGLVAEPALPRFLAIGDRCQAALTLFNESGCALTAAVRVTCSGPLRTEAPAAAVVLAAGGSARVPIPLDAGPAPGAAACRIAVDAGPHAYDETIALAVRPAAGLQAAAVSRVLAAGEQVTLAPPPAWLPATVEHSGALSALPALEWGRALEYLWTYPFGCLEQTVSGAFPLLHAADWMPRLLPRAASAGDVAVRVRAALDRVLSMQQADGGFAWWPFLVSSDADPSLYATHFLVEAQAAGYAVPHERFEAALDWLRQRLARRAPLAADTPEWQDDMDERAYACHVLALAKSPDPGWTARLQELAGRVVFSTRVHVAAALLLSGQPRAAAPILDALGLPPERPGQPGRPRDSDVQDAALLLSAWLDADPGNEAVVRLAALLLSRRQEGHWGSTYNNGLALLALGKYARLTGARERPFTGTLASAGGAPRAISSTQDVHWAYAAGEAGALTIANQGPGPLYYWSRFSGVSTDPEPDCDRGVAVRRTFLDGAGRACDPQTLKQGDLVVVRIAVDTLGRTLDHLVIEDLLPAGWEIENPNLATARVFAWLTAAAEPARYRDARDDRMLFFTGPMSGIQYFHYAARAVTPGTYRHPPVTVSGMYAPDIRSVSGGGEVCVTP